MTTALVTGIGGSIGIDIARSLALDPRIRVLGCDASEVALRMTASLVYDAVLVPRADRNPDDYLRALECVIDEREVDYVFVNPDPELAVIAECGEEMPCAVSFPRGPEVLGICMDKARTAERLMDAVVADAGEALCPATVEIDGPDDIDRAFELLEGPLWLRARSGPGGRGSLIVECPGEAKAWIDYWRRRDRRDRWMVQEYLPGVNANWTAVYRDGSCVADAAMHRTGYFLSDVAPTGVTGQVSECVTVDPGSYRERCDRAVRALVAEPEGIFSIDLREDRAGVPRVTEVNPRLAGRPWLYTRAGLNFPLSAVGSATRVEAPGPDALSLRPGVRLHRQLDIEPLVVESASSDDVNGARGGSVGGELGHLDAIAVAHDQAKGFTPRLIEARASTLARVLPSGSVLDLGCADGLLTRALASDGRQVVAVDASSVRIDRTRRNCSGLPVELRRARFEDFRPEPGERFDAVVLSCVLEHLEDPVHLLARCKEWLTPDGRVVVIVPHGRSLHRRIGVRMGLLRDLEALGPADDDLDHQRVYDMPGLVRDVGRAGFAIREKGGIFLKPLPNEAMARLPAGLVDALEELGRELPDLAAELYVVGCREREASPGASGDTR